MKKILLFAVCFLAAASCKKHNNTEKPTPMVTISFEQRIVEGHSMVRSTSNDFLDIIAEQTPKTVTVTLKNTDLNKTYTCKSTESIEVPVGNYTISAKSATPELVGETTSIYKTPLIKQSSIQTIITTATNTIAINLSYQCYAVFALVDECSSCSVRSGYLYQVPQVDKYFVCYPTQDVTVRLTPYTDSTEFAQTDFDFVTTYDKDNIFAEFGKYYVVHPTKIDATTSSFDIQFPTMQEGEI